MFERMKSRRGYTLVETVITIAILFILALGFLLMFMTSSRTLQRAVRTEDASFDAASGIAEGRFSPDPAGESEFVIRFPGSPEIRVSGDTYTGRSDDVEFHYFKPN